MNSIKRYKTRQIKVGNVAIGGDAPISVQSMTFSKTYDIKETLKQINRLYTAGANIVRLSVPSIKDARALEEITKHSPLPIVADIHFNYRLAVEAAKFVDAIRINPGNIGSNEKIKQVVKACKERNLPIRIGVNGGSLEKPIEIKYGRSPKALCESALYHIKLLEDLDFFDMKISLKTSDVQMTVESYKMLRKLCDYPFHLGITEAGTRFRSTIKSSIGLGSLLLEGIGDTMRISITGELEEEIKVGKAILKSLGLIKEGVNIISCPTCARLESDLVSAVKEVEDLTKDIKEPLNIAVMGCVVNALGEAAHADLAIAFGKKGGMIIKKGKLISKEKEATLIPRFKEELEKIIKKEANTKD